MKALGTKISELRKARGMTQDELADKMGVSPQAVSKWENDLSMPDLPVLKMCIRDRGPPDFIQICKLIWDFRKTDSFSKGDQFMSIIIDTNCYIVVDFLNDLHEYFSLLLLIK